jgi:hypothetical protein
VHGVGEGWGGGRCAKDGDQTDQGEGFLRASLTATL